MADNSIPKRKDVPERDKLNLSSLYTTQKPGRRI